MSDEILHILLLANAKAYNQPLSDILQGSGLRAQIEQIDSLDAFQTALEAAEWDAVLSTYDFIREVLPIVDGKLPVIILCENEAEEDSTFALTEPGISDILPVAEFKRLPFILRRELNVKTVRESERLHRLLIEHSADVIWILDITTMYFTYVSPSVENLRGYTAEEVMLQPVHEVVTPASLAMISGSLPQRLQDFFDGDPAAITQTHEVEQTRKDGSTVWTEVVTTLLNTSTGEVQVLGISRDISKRKQAEEALRETEGRYHRTLDSMLEGCQIIGFDWRYLYVNDTVAQQGRRSKEDLIGHTMMECYPGIEKTKLFTVLQQAMHKRTFERMETEFTYPDGSTAWFELSIHPVPEGIFILSLDITRRKQSDLALRKSEQQLRLFIEHAPASIAMFDREMRYLYYSRRWLTDYRLGQQNIIGRSHYEIFPELPDRIKEIHQRCLKGAVEKGDAEPFQRADGKLDWVRWEVHPWRDLNDEIGGIVLFSEVITERKETEEYIRKLNRMLSMLNDINQTIVRTSTIPTLFELVCQIAIEKGGFHIAWIGLFDEETSQVNPITWAGEIDDASDLALSDTSFDADRLQSGSQVIYNDIENDSRTAPWREDALCRGCRASAVFPLKLADKVQGVINLYTTETDFFSDAEIRLLDEMAGDISFAMEFIQQEEQRKQAEEAVKRYAQRMEILHQIDLGLIQGGTIQELVESTLKHIRKLIPCQRVSVAVFDQTLTEALVLASDDQTPSVINNITHTPLYPQWLEQLRTGKIFSIDDLRLIPESTPIQERMIEAGLLSALHIPLIGQEQILGSMNLAADTVGFFAPEYQEIATEIANQLAIVIRHWYLSEELARHAALLEKRVAERTNELQVAKDRVETILNNSPNGVLLAHPDMRIQQTNLTFDRQFACNGDDYFNRSILDLIHPDDVERAYIALRDGTIKHSNQYVEVRVRRKDGTTFAAELNIGQIKGGELVCTIRDVTERKQAEEVLRRSAEEIHDLYNNAPCGYHSLDKDGVIVQINDTELSWLGYTRDEVVGKLKITDLYTRDSVNTFQLNFPDFLERGWVNDLEFDLIRKDGSLIHILVNGAAIYDEQGNYLRSRSSVFDITELRRAQQALIESETRYRLLAENVTDVIAKVRPDGVRTFVTPSCYALLGYMPEELVGRPGFEIIHPDDRLQSLAVMLDSINSLKSSFMVTYRIRHKSGHYLWVEVTTSIVRDPVSGSLLEMIGVIRDISQRKRAEEGLNAKLEEEREFQSYLKALHEITIELDQIDQLDDFYQRTVELGLQRLGFDRMSLFLYDAEQDIAIGTYGTDAEGKLVDERRLRFVAKPEDVMGLAFKRAERFYINENVRLTGTDLELLGVGWNAAAILWNGVERRGWLVVDNLITHKPATKPMLEILSLYGLTVGTLLVRKEVEIAHRESEALYRLLADNITDVVMRTDPQGELVYVSPSARTVLGYEPEELLYHNTLEYIHPDDLDIALQAREAAREQGGESIQLNVRFRNKQGHYIWLETIGRAIHSPDGYPIGGFITSSRDITERKKAEEALRESEERFRQIAENIDQVLFIRSGDDKKMLYASPLYEVLTGKSCESLYDDPNAYFEVVHPEDIEYVRQELSNKLYREMGLADFEFRIIHTSGIIRWIRLRTFPIKGSGGTILRRAGTIDDITQRKQAEEALKESEARFRHVVEAAPDYILVYDTNGVIQMANPAALRESGYAQHEMIGHNIVEFFSLESHDRFEQELENTLRNGSYHQEEQFVRKDGSIVIVDCSGSVIFGEDGQPQSVIVLKRDITRRKQAEDALREALAKEKELNELKSRFVSMASHEFRTPLATILAATETLSAYRDRLTDEQIVQRLNRIKEQVGYLKDIMEDILLLAQLQARRLEFNPVLLDLDSLCRSVLDEFQSLPGVNQRIVYTYDGDVRDVKLDRKLMRQIISNLISNSIKYSPAAKPVMIHLEYKPETIIVTVRDEGIGIPPADQKHLFKSFHRAANVGSVSGTGLGLVITKEAVDLHGGTIAVESQVDVGTMFTVRLPLKPGGASANDEHSGDRR